MATAIQRRGFFGLKNEWECSKCEKEVMPGATACPYCGANFLYDDDESDYYGRNSMT